MATGNNPIKKKKKMARAYMANEIRCTTAK